MKYSLPAIFALAWAGLADAACSSNKVIDNYADFSNHRNSFGQPTSDDGTTQNLRADTANKKISLTAKSGSYLYTNFGCENIQSQGYNAIQFPVKGPPGSSLGIELQTVGSCGNTAFHGNSTTKSGLTGQTQTFTIPLSDFAGANPDAVHGIAWQFSPGEWELGQTSFVCGSSSRGAEAPALTSEPELVGTTKNAPRANDACSAYLVDDFPSQSRLTFLYYNALLQPTSDDGTMKPVTGRVDTTTSVIVENNHLTLTPANASSYWFTSLGCLKATNTYGGLGMAIKADPGTTFSAQLQSDPACSTTNPKSVEVTSADLGMTFDGSEKYFSIPFSKFQGIDQDHLVSLLITGLSGPVTFGPIAAYCGNTGSAYPLPATVEVSEPVSTIPATTAASGLVIDSFNSADNNDLGFYHGGDEPSTFKVANGKLELDMKGDSDQSWYTQVANGCGDLTSMDKGYLHIAYSGSNAFTVSLQQHNQACDANAGPVPFTWDSVEAGRYSNSAKSDIYIPLTHFGIDRSKSIGFGLKGFYSKDTTTVSKIEIVQTVPGDFVVPSKLPTSQLIFSCSRPNSFAFAIDDGDPKFAQQVVSSISAAGIKVTFFTVGAALLDKTNNLTGVYNGMIKAGHQIAYHSYTHPPMEGLPNLAAIDWELDNDFDAVQKSLGMKSKYFRPPFGTEGARVRQRVESKIPGSKFVMWSVDVQDYLWATSPTPENQVTNFQKDVAKGGNLVVMHYLYETTVNYIPRFIEIAKATGKQLMRVDQCMEDPDAPPL